MGMAHGERDPSQLVQHKGYRERDWEARVETDELRIPKLRMGGNVPGFLALMM